MKYAVIADIHGNLPALELVLNDAEKQGAKGYLLAGDYCISAPWANQVLDRLRGLPHACHIRGNDENHLDVPPGDDGQFAVSRWCASTISPENKAWMDALPEKIMLTCQGVSIHMAHAAQAFVGDTIFTHFNAGSLPFRYPNGAIGWQDLNADFQHTMAADSGFQSALSGLTPGVYISAHNHIQCWGNFSGRLFLNPGSCGLPLDCGEFAACYALLTIENGKARVEVRRISYDVEKLIEQVKATEQYTAARVWSETIFSEWRTRREKVWYVLQNAERYAQEIGDLRRPFAPDTWEAAFRRWQETEQYKYPELFAR